MWPALAKLMWSLCRTIFTWIEKYKGTIFLAFSCLESLGAEYPILFNGLEQQACCEHENHTKAVPSNSQGIINIG